MNFFPFLIIALINILIGGFIYFKNPRKHTNIAFGILSLVIASWIVSLFILLNSHTYQMALLWGRLTFTAGMWAPSALVHFVYSFPNKRLSNKKIYLIYGIGTIAMLLTLTPWIIKDVRMESWGLLPVIGSAYWIIIAYFISFLGLVVFRLLKGIKNSSGLERLQLIYIAIGFVVVIGHQFVTNMILPLLGFKDVYVWGPWNSVELELIFGYAILRYRLMDISVVIKRTTLYLLLVIFVTGVFSFIILLPQKYFVTSNNTNSVILMLISAAIISFTLQPMRNWLDQITDKIFFQRKYNYFQLLEQISRDLSTMVRLEDMLNMTSTALLNAMHLEKIGIYILGRTTGQLEFQCVKKIEDKDGGLPEQIVENSPVVKFLSETKKIIVTGEFFHEYGHLYSKGKIIDPIKASIQEDLDHLLKASVVIPLWLKSHLSGFLVLGEKKSGDSFTDRDLSFLETIANQMSVVLENTRLYEQMLNNERLTVLGAMSASIAHEIRNPLAAIKTFVQMLPNKYQQADFRMRFHEIVPGELDRLTRITEDLLIFARPSLPAFVATEVNVILERVLTLMHNQLRKRGIEVVSEFAPLPNIQADGQQLTQVFMNLILNAIQASKPQKKIYIATKFVQGNSETVYTGSAIFVTIKDEGVGIADKDIFNVFQPFFTTKHEGTGLGLPTSKRIVDAHHGEIYLESEVGVGTAFTVVLPLQQPTSETVSL